MAAEELSNLFQFNIPMRWSVSQYYQSVIDNLSHVKAVAFLTTLSGYVHYRLTGERVLGIDDASGMFPVDGTSYDKGMMEKFNALLQSKGVAVDFESLLPKVLLAGDNAGKLTGAGARWLDVSGNLEAGVPCCPPEGDMGTGVVATNTVAPRTGNISSGTSANLTVILEKPLKKYYKAIDVVATPDGATTALIHTNNCTTEINEWVNVFGETLALFGVKVDKGELFTKLFEHSLQSDENAGGIVSYNFLAGEPLANTKQGAPLVMRSPNGKMNLANFMQSQIYSAIATLAIGMNILKEEGVAIDSILAHGGFYKTNFVGQNATSAILGVPVTVMEHAAEGGAWGMAVLALYAILKKGSLPEFLQDIFKDAKQTVVVASEEEKAKCKRFMDAYYKGLPVEKLASEEL